VTQEHGEEVAGVAIAISVPYWSAFGLL